jgi:hypothetical protein
MIGYIPESKTFLIQNFATDEIQWYINPISARDISFDGLGHNSHNYLTAVRYLVCLGVKNLIHIPGIFLDFYKDADNEFESFFQHVFAKIVFFEDGLIPYESDQDGFVKDSKYIIDLRKGIKRIYSEDQEHKYVKILRDFFEIYRTDAGLLIIDLSLGMILIEKA